MALSREQRDSETNVRVEIKEPKGFGRVRMQRIAAITKECLIPFITGAVEPGATVHTDGNQAYWTVPDHGYRHKRTVLSKQDDPAHVVMPGVHRVASLLKRWLLGTHQGSVSPEHLDAYLNEFAFRFNRRRSRRAACCSTAARAGRHHRPGHLPQPDRQSTSHRPQAATSAAIARISSS